jgi:hypothetical protein
MGRLKGAILGAAMLLAQATGQNTSVPKPPSDQSKFSAFFGPKEEIRDYARDRAPELAHLIITAGSPAEARKFDAYNLHFKEHGLRELTLCMKPMKVDEYELSACLIRGDAKTLSYDDHVVLLSKRGAKQSGEKNKIKNYVRSAPLLIGLVDAHHDGLGTHDLFIGRIEGKLVENYSFGVAEGADPKLFPKADPGTLKEEHRVHYRHFTGVCDETVIDIESSFLTGTIRKEIEANNGYGKLLYFILTHQNAENADPGKMRATAEETVHYVHEQLENGIEKRLSKDCKNKLF